MSIEKQFNLLYIKDENSKLNSDSQIFEELFSQVDKVTTPAEAFKLFQEKSYDLIIGDLTTDIKKLDILKQLIEQNKDQVIFSLVSANDAEKFYGIADLGINAVELEPSQFDNALNAIVDYLKQQSAN